NKRAKFEYEILDKYVAGIVLTGTEIKSIRMGKANIADSFCEFSNGELFAINTHIEEYSFGTHYNHKEKSKRKLLLKRRELKWLEKVYKLKGLRLFRYDFLSMKGVWQKWKSLWGEVKNYTTNAKPSKTAKVKSTSID